MGQQFKNSTPGKQSSPNRGFSLIELLIVVAVILIIASIAIPSFIQSKMRANEAAAVQNIRNVTTAEVVYSTTYGIGYSNTLVQLAGNGVALDQNDAELIDEVLGSGIKSGYLFSYTVLTQDAQGHVTGYSVNADPQSPASGTRHFYTDQMSLIHSNDATTAGPSDPPIQ